MNETYKTLFKDKIIFWTLLLELLLFIGVVIYSISIYKQLPPILPVYNRLSWGYGRLGEKNALFIPFILAILFCTINFFTTAVIYKRVVLLSRLISLISFTLTLCMSIYIFKIAQLVL